MNKANNSKKPISQKAPIAITELSVSGYKSIAEEETIEIRPLTILAGANSSGKSSVMQPLLLLKQTLEASYNPGPLLLSGPNVKFTSVDQLLSRTGKRVSTDILEIAVKSSWDRSLRITFRKKHGHGLVIDQMQSVGSLGDYTVWPTMTHNEIQRLKFATQKSWEDELPEQYRKIAQWQIVQNRCFLEPQLVVGEDHVAGTGGPEYFGGPVLTEGFDKLISALIHLPALRGNPERDYPVSAVGATYPGTFDKYAASVIAEWAKEDEHTSLQGLNDDLAKMRLTGGVWPQKIYETRIELHVSRLPQAPPRRPEDRVNIADVGVGVSQTLPVLVALRAAQPGQLVFLEEPETHLHPRAQTALAGVLVAAATRGVQLVLETHSSLLLLAIQTLVAEGSLSPSKVKLHWFQRNKDGRTTIRSADLDEAGAFGEWPEDFDDVTLAAQKKYLDAADKRLLAK